MHALRTRSFSGFGYWFYSGAVYGHVQAQKIKDATQPQTHTGPPHQRGSNAPAAHAALPTAGAGAYSGAGNAYYALTIQNSATIITQMINSAPIYPATYTPATAGKGSFGAKRGQKCDCGQSPVTENTRSTAWAQFVTRNCTRAFAPMLWTAADCAHTTAGMVLSIADCPRSVATMPSVIVYSIRTVACMQWAAVYCTQSVESVQWTATNYIRSKNIT